MTKTASCQGNQDGQTGKLPRQLSWPNQQVAHSTKLAKPANCPVNQAGQTSKLPRQLSWPNQQVAHSTKLAKPASCPDNQAGQNSMLPRQPSWPKQQAAKATKMAKPASCPDNQAGQNSKLPRQPRWPNQQVAQSTKLAKAARCSMPLIALPFQLHLSKICTDRAVSHQGGMQGAQLCHSGDGVQALQQTGHVVQRLSTPTNHCVTGEGWGQKALIDERFEPHDRWVVCKMKRLSLEEVFFLLFFESMKRKKKKGGGGKRKKKIFNSIKSAKLFSTNDFISWGIHTLKLFYCHCTHTRMKGTSSVNECHY